MMINIRKVYNSYFAMLGYRRVVLSAEKDSYGSAALISHIWPLKGETFEEHPILAKYKEGDNFNQRNTLKYFED